MIKRRLTKTLYRPRRKLFNTSENTLSYPQTRNSNALNLIKRDKLHNRKILAQKIPKAKN